MRAVRIAVICCTVVAGALSPPAVGAGSDGWEPAVPLSRVGADVWDLEVDLREGRGLAAWVQWEGDRTRLKVTRQREDGSWARPRGVRGTGEVVEVEVATDDRDRTWLAWTAGRCVLSARLLRDGTTTPAVVLHRTPDGPLGTLPAYLQLDVNARGAAVVAWETMDDDQDAPYAEPVAQAVARDARGGWGPARTLSAPGTAGLRPEVFVSRRGRMTVVWGERGGGAWAVRTTSRTAGADWAPSESLSHVDERAGVPHLAGLPSGRLAVAFASRSAEGRRAVVRQWAGSSGWSAPAPVRGARLASWIDAGVSRVGAVVAFTDRHDAAWTASVSRTGEVARTRLFPEVEVYYGMQLAVSPSGEAVVAWDSVDGGDHPIQAAHRRRDGSWDRVVRLSGAGVDGFLGSPVIEPDGHALVLWSGGDLVDPDASRVWVSSRG